MRDMVGASVLVGGCIFLLGCGAATTASTATPTPAPSGTASAAVTVVPTAADVFPAQFLAGTADSLGTATGKTIGATATRKYMVGRRVATGAAEVHARWTDLVFVQAGRATLVTGGSLVDGKEDSPGEQRAPSIAGGAQHVLGAGDLVIIPAGVPHQYTLAPGDTLRYLTLKVLEQ